MCRHFMVTNSGPQEENVIYPCCIHEEKGQKSSVTFPVTLRKAVGRWQRRHNI